MKNKILLFLMGLLLVACNQAELEPLGESQNQIENNNLISRSEKDAINLATSAASSLFSSDNRGELRKVSSLDQVIKGGISGRSSEALYYVVNFDDNLGFAIVPTDSTNQNVIAITDSGSLNPNDNISNPGLKLYLQATENYLASEISEDEKFSPFSASASVIEELQVAPRLKMILNQDYPENLYATNKYAGCGPVAMLLAMSFVKEPTQMTMTFTSTPHPTLYINWEELELHNAGLHEYGTEYGGRNCPASSNSHSQISYLCKEIGYRTNSIYGTGGTTTYPSELYSFIRDVMPNYSYTIYDTSMNCSILDAALWDGIVLIEGWDSTGRDGHYWLADGIHRYVYNNGTDIFGNPQYSEISTIYYHFNWGWGGACNGYFSPNVFNPNKGSIYDGDNNSSYHQYSVLRSGVAFYKYDNKYN